MAGLPANLFLSEKRRQLILSCKAASGLRREDDWKFAVEGEGSSGEIAGILLVERR